MKWIKKNKFTVVAIIMFVLVAVLCYKIVDIFFPNQRSAVYGDRLEGKVNVDKKVYTEVKAKVSESDKVKKVTLRENGRRIDIVITVVDDIDKPTAKKLTDHITDFFTESQLGYYDFQVYVKKENSDANDFPIIGYKHHNNSSFSWTKDREYKEKTEEDK